MQTTSTDSSIHFHETDTADDALEVRVLWGSELLQVTHLSPPRPFVVGERDDTDFTLPASVLGSVREEIPMRDGAHTAGGLIFQVRNVASATRVGGATPNAITANIAAARISASTVSAVGNRKRRRERSASGVTGSM